MVTKISKKKPAKPDYFERILKMYPDGTPCQSSVFTDVPDIAVRKNQVEIGLCQRACPPSKRICIWSFSHRRHFSSFL